MEEKNSKLNIILMVVMIFLLGITATLLFLLLRNNNNLNNSKIEKEEEIVKIDEKDKAKDIEISKKQEIKKEEKNQTTVLGKGQILFAEKNQNQNPPSANPKNLVTEYFIYSFDPKTNDKKQFGLVKANFFHPVFKLLGDKLFFMSQGGELATLDLKSKKQEIIKISGIVPAEKYNYEKSLNQFIISDNIVFYFKGDCSEGGYCAVGSYNLTNTENKILFDNLDKQVDTSFMSVAILKNYNSLNNSLEILSSGGDACLGWATLYSLDINKSVVSQTEKVNYTGCEDDLASSNPESEKNKLKNKRYEEVVGRSIVQCGDFNIDEFIRKIQEKNGFDSEAAHFIDCIK